MNINTGTVLKGRYEILAQIGEGGFATVFHAKDLELNRDVAVKIVKVTASESLARFQREARVLANLSHKNILAIYAIDIIDDQIPFLVMEYLSGETLIQILQNQKGLNYEQFISIFNQVCEGLEYAHKSGTVHRDLSPANIFLSSEPSGSNVKILDFGLSKLFGDESGAALTATGMLVGNPPYMSPEQARGATLDQRSDIYSLGCVAYECLTGKTAFESNSLVTMLALQQTEYPEEPQSSWRNSESEDLIKSIILKCLQKDPEKRFQSCTEILHALDKGTTPDGTPVDRSLERWANKFGTRRKKKTFSPWAAGVLLTGLLIFISFTLFQDTTTGLLVDLEISLNQPALAPLELSQAESLLYKHNTAIAAKLYRHAASLLATKGDYLGEAEVNLSIAECMQEADDKKGVEKSLSQFLNIMKDVPDSKAKEKLLSKSWILLKAAHAESPRAEIYGTLQVRNLKMLVASKYRNKTELRKQFSSYLATLNKYDSSDKPSLKCIKEILVIFLGTSPVIMSNQTVNDIETIAYACHELLGEEEYSELQKARLDAAELTHEETSRIKYNIALFSTNPDETLKTIKQIKEDQNVRGKVLALTLLLESQVYLEQKNPVEALKSANYGLNLDRSVYQERTLSPLFAAKVIALHRLGRNEEIESNISNMLVSQWSDLQSNDIATESMGRLIKVSDHSEANYFFQRNWLSCLEALVETEHLDLARKEVEHLYSLLKQNDLHVHINVRGAMVDAIKTIKDPSLAKQMKKLLAV